MEKSKSSWKPNPNVAFAWVVANLMILIYYLTVPESQALAFHWWYWILCFFLSYPYKIGKNVYSLFGGINEDGCVYSIISLFSEGRYFRTLFNIYGNGKGKGVSVAFFFNLYAKTSGSFCFALGISLIQIAKDEIVTVLNISIFEKADTLSSGLGLHIFSKYLEKDFKTASFFVFEKEERKE